MKKRKITIGKPFFLIMAVCILLSDSSSAQDMESEGKKEHGVSFSLNFLSSPGFKDVLGGGIMISYDHRGEKLYQMALISISRFDKADVGPLNFMGIEHTLNYMLGMLTPIKKAQLITSIGPSFGHVRFRSSYRESEGSNFSHETHVYQDSWAIGCMGSFQVQKPISDKLKVKLGTFLKFIYSNWLRIEESPYDQSIQHWNFLYGVSAGVVVSLNK